MTEVSIEPATLAELDVTGRLHERALDSGLFPSLGHRFLARYHATFVASPHAIALVARDGGPDPIGFLVGTTDNPAHYRWTVRHHGWRLALSAVAAMALRPPVAWEFLRTRLGRYVRGLRRYLRPARRAASAASVAAPPSAPATAEGPAAPRPRVAILTHVATDERRRAGGVGRGLCETFLELAREHGAGEARCITTLDSDAAGFYTRLGWTRVTDRDARDGASVREFRVPLRTAEPS